MLTLVSLLARSAVSEDAKYLVLHRKVPTRKMFRDSYSMMEFAREIIRPRQLKLTRIREIVLSSSSSGGRASNSKYIKLVYANKRKKRDESVKLLFQDSSVFSRWTLALSALVYTWKWLEMPQGGARQSQEEKREQLERERRRIHELGPTGKQLVSDILCSLVVNDKVQKKYWPRVSKLLSELDFWSWSLPTPQQDAQRREVYQRIHDGDGEGSLREHEPRGRGASRDEAEREEAREEVEVKVPEPAVRRNNSAPVVLSNLNELYTIPEDKLPGPCPRNGSGRTQKIFRRVSNHQAIECPGSSDSEAAAPSEGEEEEAPPRPEMHTRVVHPVSSSVGSEVEAGASGKENEASNCSGKNGKGGDEFSKEFFSALNTLERKSKWKRKMRQVKSFVVCNLKDLEAGITALERDIDGSDLLGHCNEAAAGSVVDEDILKASLWRTVVQLSLNLQKEKEMHLKTKAELKESRGRRAPFSSTENES